MCIRDRLDATDGLAAAYCHFLQAGRPVSEKAYAGWKDFVAKNEDKVKKTKRIDKSLPNS